MMPHTNGFWSNSSNPLRDVEEPRPSLVEVAAERLVRAVAPLCRMTDFNGRADRRSFLSALVLAIAIVAIARAMDWLIFGAIPGSAPLYFAAIVGLALTLPVSAISVRRLHDAGHGARTLLLLLLPVCGWLALAWLLSRRSV